MGRKILGKTVGKTGSVVKDSGEAEKQKVLKIGKG